MHIYYQGSDSVSPSEPELMAIGVIANSVSIRVVLKADINLRTVVNYPYPAPGIPSKTIL